MVKHFNKALLSPKGFFVDIADVDVTLPNGEKVDSGMQFRNSFHLHPLASAELFVPCGGRPEAVNMTNVEKLFFKKENGDLGAPYFKYIVEGANLFFSQEARLFLEKNGVVIIKDASANKGGVTSSSLEVLAALALTDSEYDQLMTVKHSIPKRKGLSSEELAKDVVTVPEFYQKYVEEVQYIIEENAAAEFSCLWQAHQEGVSLTLGSDMLSKKIIEMTNSIAKSNLFETQTKLRDVVLGRAIPKTLQNLLSLEKIITNLPPNYIRALFASSLASRFIYKCGINPDSFAFFQFVQDFVGASSSK